MKAEDKELLVRAICGYLPYGLEVNYDNEICDCVGYVHGKVILTKKFSSVSFGVDVEKVKPYLRPLLSMMIVGFMFGFMGWMLNKRDNFTFWAEMACVVMMIYGIWLL